MIDSYRRLVAFAALAAFAFPALAQQAPAKPAAAAKGPVESRLEARKVTVAADGKEALASAEGAKPGEVIEYTATYRNSGKTAVRAMEATLPIPVNTEFVPGSPKPAGAKASVDGKNFADMPLKRTVQRAGKPVEELVPVREYRFLRWYPNELAAGGDVAVTARVKVIDDRPAAAPTAPPAKEGKK